MAPINIIAPRMSPYSLLELQAGWLGIDNSKQLNFVTDTCFFLVGKEAVQYTLMTGLALC